MRMIATQLSVAEYFAGIGLVRMGLETSGWKVAFANDFSAKKLAMYKAFYPKSSNHYVVEDIFKLDPATIPLTTLATCSFPCIDLSLAGNMNGIVDGDHSSAFWGFTKILKAYGSLGPPLVLVENVPGWLISNNGKDFRVTVKALNELGYACDVFVLDALRFTPQSRLRVFLVGSRLAPKKTTPELLLTRPKSLLSDQLRERILANKDLRWFYNDLCPPPDLKTHGLSEIVERLDDTDKRWWSQQEVDRHLAMMNDTHRKRVEQLRYGPGLGFRTFYRRRRAGMQRAEVRDDDLSGCLRTAVGGSGKQFLIQAGLGSVKMRTMTPREYARLQGVPDRFQITVNETQALTGFGDAVCVPAIAWIAKHILTPLAKQYSPESDLEPATPQMYLFEKK